MSIQTTKMTSRGQVVIPQAIRQNKKIKQGESFLVYDLDDSIVLKRIKNLENVKNIDQFEKVFSSMWQTTKAKNITKKDIEEQIKEYRKENA